MLFKLYCRTYQKIMKVLSNLLYWRKTKVLTGTDSYKTLATLVKNKGKALIVTDRGITRLGLEKRLIEALDDCSVSYVLYDGTLSNPTTDNVEEAAALYRKNGCRAIIAIGGGSSIDCAKGAAIRIRRKRTKLSSLKGLLKVHCILPPLFIIPTTAGTGSETTVAAVITDSATHDKYAISDVALIPPYALFDPELLRKLPPSLTGSTGMDALCHAVEAYIGGSNTRRTREDALRAISLIDRNLYRSYQNGDDIKARVNMQYASFYAGRAFTRAYVGSVHAIAHALGALYGTPHGEANAILLPHVLRAYGKSAEKKLSELSIHLGLDAEDESEHALALSFIEYIEDLNRKLHTPENIEALRKSDIEEIARRAEKESNPTYPVPVIWKRKDYEAVLHKLYALREDMRQRA